MNVKLLTDLLGVSFVTANKLVGSFEELGILIEVTGGRRSRIFRYDPYLALFEDPVGDTDESAVESTETSG